MNATATSIGQESGDAAAPRAGLMFQTNADIIAPAEEPANDP